MKTTRETEIKIETGIPIPPKYSIGNASLLTQAIRNLKPGESFVIKNNRVSAAGGIARSRKIKIVTRRIKGTDTTRIWLAPTP